MSSYRVVPYSPAHRTLVAELQCNLWSPDVALNASYLEWRYHRNPYIEEPLIYLAFHGDELAGMRGAIGTRWEIGEAVDRFVLPYFDDLVVDPAHRVKGLHRIIMEHALRDLARRGYRYVMNLSASHVTALQSLRMKWRSAGHVRPLHRRTARRAAIDGLVYRARRTPLLWRCVGSLGGLGGASGRRAFDCIDTGLATPRRRGSIGSVFVELEPRVAEMADLVQRLPRDGRIRHVRDHAFFGWRFANPLRRYRFVYAAGQRLDGYLVLQQPIDAAETSVSVADWEAVNDDVRQALIEAAVEYGGFAEMRAWSIGTPPCGRQALERCGFEPDRERYDVHLLVRAVRDDDLVAPWTLAGRRLDDASDWDPRLIDSTIG